MARYKLTWRENERRWAKKRHGRQHYFPLLKHERGKTDSSRQCNRPSARGLFADAQASERGADTVDR
jgi:hypothetical protein